jgi:cell division protein FtsL
MRKLSDIITILFLPLILIVGIIFTAFAAVYGYLIEDEE